jgi:polysaccharide deacetylase 2 family uncharacterized protein YibQ
MMPLPEPLRAVYFLDSVQRAHDSVADHQAGRHRVGVGSAGRLIDHTVDNSQGQ